MKENLLRILEQHYSEILSLHERVKKETTTQVTKAPLQNSTKELCRNWFDNLRPQIEILKVSKDEINVYSDRFKKLLEYSRKSTRRSSYLTILDILRKNYQKNFIHEIETKNFDVGSGLNILPYIEGLETDEKDYLKEAAKCAQNDCKRASILIGWCATIDKIHRKIEALGFDKFNQATTEMKGKTYGKFKRFNKKYDLNSLSELREVFDTDILWVLDYLQLIDGTNMNGSDIVFY